MTEFLRSGLGSRAVAQRFATHLSARLHALYDPTVEEQLPTLWRELIAATPTTIAASTTSSGGGGAEENSSPSLRILLVEDDGFIRLTCGASLRRLGHLVHEAASGEEALALLDDWLIDVLITDVSLPSFSGVELSRRAAERAPAIRTIFATGLRVKDLGGTLPAHALLMPKPYGESELRRALHEVILL